MNMLAIDTSNQTMGVAIMKQNQIVAEIITNSNNDHSSRLMPAITELMEKTQLTPERLNKIIVTKGPGSYTGTRIGIVTAKTLAWALNIPIITISSLEALAFNGAYFNGYICPFFDARRKSIFTGLYEWQSESNTLRQIKPETNILLEKWLTDMNTLRKPILFLSPDIEKFRNTISEQCSLSVFPVQSVQLLRPSHLFQLQVHRKETSVHEAVPNYLRITEAEANLEKTQEDEQHHG